MVEESRPGSSTTFHDFSPAYVEAYLLRGSLTLLFNDINRKKRKRQHEQYQKQSYVKSKNSQSAATHPGLAGNLRATMLRRGNRKCLKVALASKDVIHDVDLATKTSSALLKNLNDFSSIRGGGGRKAGGVEAKYGARKTGEPEPRTVYIYIYIYLLPAIASLRDCLSRLHK